MEKITINIHTSLNESIHNIFSIYRDKTKNYTHYDLLYQMGYLDVNENRDQKIRWKYTTQIRNWKKNHKKRVNRSIKELKTRH